MVLMEAWKTKMATIPLQSNNISTPGLVQSESSHTAGYVSVAHPFIQQLMSMCAGTSGQLPTTVGVMNTENMLHSEDRVRTPGNDSMLSSSPQNDGISLSSRQLNVCTSSKNEAPSFHMQADGDVVEKPIEPEEAPSAAQHEFRSGLATEGDVCMWPRPSIEGGSRGTLPITPPSSPQSAAASMSITAMRPLSRGPVGIQDAAAAQLVSMEDMTFKSKRAEQRRVRSEYMRAQRAGSEAAGRTHIPTNSEGKVTALKTVLNRSIRDIAGRVLDLSVIHFNEHPEMGFQLIEHDIDRHFYFDPPLKVGYIRKYLMESLAASRYQWQQYWKMHGKCHPNCPPKRFPALLSYWQTEAAEEESRRMQAARASRDEVAMDSDDDDDLQVLGGNPGGRKEDWQGNNQEPDVQVIKHAAFLII